ncbi:MAG: alkaline phosphatase [Pseudomonadota bacterium]
MRFSISGAVALILAACAPPAPGQSLLPPAPKDPTGFAAGADVIAQRIALKPNLARAKNIVLMVGDGMGVSTITAGRIYAGQKLGKLGEEHSLTFERLPYAALIKTYNTDQQVSDSAGTATAMVTGLKTRAGVINTAPSVRRGNCPDALKNPLPTLTQQAIALGKAAGVVSSARLTHATPAVMYAVSADRNWESDKTTPDAAKDAGCTAIARQLVEGKHGLMVAMGGGARAFDEDMMDRWPGAVVTTKADMTVAQQTPLLGLFAPSHLPYTLEKAAASTAPSLADMTNKALSLLAQSGDGFFLMVEGGRIDHGHHAGKAALALEELRAFDDAVAVVLERVDLANTLVLVTADHSHTFTIAGYPKRGNDILGPVYYNDPSGETDGILALARDGRPYTTLGYMNGPGAKDGVRDPSQVPPGTITRQPALIPFTSETHAGEDVALFAAGPWAHLVGGVMEQHVIYHLMAHALGLAP